MKRLIALRKQENDVLTYGALEWRLVSDENDFVSFSRTDEGKELIYFFHQGSEVRRVRLRDLKIASDKRIYDAWSEEAIIDDAVDIQPGGFFILGAV
jgi:glycosidase